MICRVMWKSRIQGFGCVVHLWCTLVNVEKKAVHCLISSWIIFTIKSHSASLILFGCSFLTVLYGCILHVGICLFTVVIIMICVLLCHQGTSPDHEEDWNEACAAAWLRLCVRPGHWVPDPWPRNTSDCWYGNMDNKLLKLSSLVGIYLSGLSFVIFMKLLNWVLRIYFPSAFRWDGTILVVTVPYGDLTLAIQCISLLYICFSICVAASSGRAGRQIS